MKKTIALLLVLCMTACLLPAFSLVSTAESADQYGLTADFYQIEKEGGNFGLQYAPLVGNTDGESSRVNYNDCKHFDTSIDLIMKTSVAVTQYGAEHVTAFDNLINENSYVIKWEGTVTASEDGTYYLIGRKVDNGFTMFVDQGGKMEKVYEYWAFNHWFDGPDDRLPTDLGGFTLKAGVPTNIEAYYLEGTGGEALSFEISTNSDFSNAVSMGSMLTFDMTRTVYASKYSNDHSILESLIPWGNGNGQGEKNFKKADDPANHHYAESFDKVKAAMTKLGSCTVPNYETESQAYGHQFYYFDEDCMIEYNGYVTSTIGGTYTFGTSKVDNCLYVEIIDDAGKVQVAYEFWGSGIYNDKEPTFSDTTVTLEKGKAYKIHAVFIEMDGGQWVESLFKIDDRMDPVTLADSGLVFTVNKPTSQVVDPVTPLFVRGSEWYYMTSGEYDEDEPAAGWATDSDVYGAWDTAEADLGQGGSDVWSSYDVSEGQEGGQTMNKRLWAVREFEVEDLDAIKGAALMADMRFDDNIHIYINGIPVYINPRWIDEYQTFKLAEKAEDLLHEGTNVVAASLIQGFGGYHFDMGLSASKANTSNYGVCMPLTRTTETLEGNQDYKFFMQTKPSAEAGKVDVRVICVGKESFFLQKDVGYHAKITLTAGGETKTLIDTPRTAFKNVIASTTSDVNIYTAADGLLIFGWVITGVPADVTGVAVLEK